MRIVTDAVALDATLRGAAFALGNFDGVHAGHARVVEDAVRVARSQGRLAGAAVFEPHPRQVFAPDAAPFRLQSPGQRARALAALGVALIVEIRFDAELAKLTDAEFVRQVLVQQLGAAHVAVGADFTFGRGRMGNAQSLAQLGAAQGLSVSAVEVVGGMEKVSSSAIRTAIAHGRMDEAAQLLGRPWAIEGIVLPGQARGRTIGFPTLNLGLGSYQRPAFGVYAVRVDTGDGVLRPGVANCGVRPTVGGETPLLEAHLFDYEGDLYGRRVEVALVKHLRAERKFENFDALKTQIAEDAVQARAALL
jgi:riboflavin kinase/FMN adenylyltransferase